MWILSGEICGYSGRSGDAGASSWGNSAVNWILMAVLGNRSVHLRREGAGEAGTQGATHVARAHPRRGSHPGTRPHALVRTPQHRSQVSFSGACERETRTSPNT